MCKFLKRLLQQTHTDAPPPAHCTAAASACTACNLHHQQPLCICLASHTHNVRVCLSESVWTSVCYWILNSVPRWAGHPESCNLIVLLFFCDSCRCRCCSLQIKYENVWISPASFPTSSSLSPNLPQKRAKKLEGETIYIRHSNLMLEVRIFSLQMSVLAVCPHVFSSCMDFVLISLFLLCFFYSSLSFSSFLALFSA